MRRSGWMAAALLVVGLGVAGCSGTSSAADEGGHEPPAKVEAIPGTDVKKVTLTERAVQRLDIKTVAIGAARPQARVAAQPAAPGGQAGTAPTVVPYAAVVYDPDGGTWVYTVPAPRTYVREKVVVASVSGVGGTEAALTAGPAAGTEIVSTGVIELYGAELGVGEEE